MDENNITQEELLQIANNYVEQQQLQECFDFLSDKTEQFEKNVELLKLYGLCCVNLQKDDLAIETFEKVVAISIDDATSWFYLGAQYDKKGMLPEAQEAYEKVIELRDEFLDAHKNLAIVLIKSNDFEKAKEHAERALELAKEEDYQVYYILSTIAMRENNFNLVIEYTEKALKLNPTHIQLINNLGSAYLGLFDFKKAETYYKKAYEIDAEHPVTNYNLGMLKQLMQKDKEAFPFLEKAYKADSSLCNLTAVAESAMKNKKWQDAIKYYTILTGLEPQKIAYHRNLANALIAEKDYESAINSLSIVQAAEPANMELVEQLVDLYLLTNEYKKLKILLYKVSKRGKISVNLYYTYAIVCAKTGEIDEAISLFKKVCLLSPKDPVPHKDLGVIYLAQKLFDYARIEFKTAYELAPDNPIMTFEYATFLYQIHEYNAALPLYEKALKLESGNLNINLYAGLNYLQLNELDKALKLLTKVYKKMPNDSVVAFTLARIYYLKKNFEAAKQFLIGLSSFNNDLEIYNLFALIHVELKEFEEATAIYKKINELSPGTPNILMQLAKCEIELNHIDDALKYLDQYLEVVPDSEEANELIRKIS